MKLFQYIFIITILFVIALSSTALAGKKLTVGVTLHPYYSWVANIAGDTVEILPAIPAEVDPHSYQPRPQDLEKLGTMDAIVVNTLGHDAYVDNMLKAAGRESIQRIKPNSGIALIPSAHKSYSFQNSNEEKVSYNSHTYVSLLGAVQQVNTIASDLARLVPEHARTYEENARNYNKKLRKILRAANQKLKQAEKADSLRIATVHDGYAYLFQELGIETDAVVQPRHGIEPSARQLADTIKRIKKAHVNVLFTEVDYQKKYVDTIYQETGCRLYSLSHISNGPYSADKFIRDMQNNVDVIVNALASSNN